jgi:hypothetical protein
MPWLYYENTADKVLNATDRVQFDVSFDPNDKVNINQLPLYIAKYFYFLFFFLDMIYMAIFMVFN